MTSVLIIDHHPLITKGCRHLLEAAGIEAILCAEDFAIGCALYQANQPDVVVLDLSFGNDPLAGLSFVHRIKAEGGRTRVIIFSMHDDPAIVDHCLKAGVSDYVVKDGCPSELVRAVRGELTVLPAPHRDRRATTVVDRPPTTE